MNWSTQKKISPPIRFATIAAMISHARKEDADTGKDRGARLSPEKVECIPFEIDPQTGIFGPVTIKGLCRFPVRYTRTIYPADKY